MFELDEIIAGSVAHRELWARVSTRPDGEGHRCTAWWRPPSGPASSAGLRTPLWPDGRRWASCSTPRPSCIGRTPRPAMDFERRPLASPGPGNIWIFSRVKSLLEVHPVAAHNNNPDHPAKRMIPPFWEGIPKWDPHKTHVFLIPVTTTSSTSHFAPWRWALRSQHSHLPLWWRLCA